MPESPFSNSPFTASPEQSSGGLLDIGFTRFITNTWISIIWVIVIVVHFLTPCVVFVAAANMAGGGAAVMTAFMLSIPLTLLSLLFCRMGLEVLIVLFRIESNTRATKEQSGQ